MNGRTATQQPTIGDTVVVLVEGVPIQRRVNGVYHSPAQKSWLNVTEHAHLDPEWIPLTDVIEVRTPLPT